MASFYESITEDQQAFIARQHMFFVATGTGESRINLSPKGMDTFRVLDANTVCYLDYTGSGIETAAHLQHDGRVTFMMCSFDQKPNILRLYGRGDVVKPGDGAWDSLRALFDDYNPGARQIIRARVEMTQDSCGFAIPRYEFVSDRHTLREFALKRGEDGLVAYRAEKNTKSIDGLTVSG